MEYLFSCIGFIPVIILAVSGFLIKYKKAYWLISGYNTMGAEKKKNVDVIGLGKFIGNVLLVIAALTAAAGVLLAFGQINIAGFIYILLVPIIVYTIISAQKFDGNTRKSDGNVIKTDGDTAKCDGNAKTGVKISISIIFTFIVVAFVAALLFFSNQQAKYTIKNDELNISGLYGVSVELKEISSLELTDSLPKVTTKTNGAWLGHKLKGHFLMESVGAVLLFIDDSKAPFIWVEKGNQNIIFNCEDSEKTKEFYDNLNTEWKKAANK